MRKYFDFSADNFKLAGIALVCLFIGSCLVNLFPAGKELVQFKIVDRVYKPDYYTYSTDSKGHTSSTYHPESWHLKLQYANGEVCDMDCTQTQYYTAMQGAHILVYEYRGCLYHNIVYRYPKSEIDKK